MEPQCSIAVPSGHLPWRWRPHFLRLSSRPGLNALPPLQLSSYFHVCCSDTGSECRASWFPLNPHWIPHPLRSATVLYIQIPMGPFTTGSPLSSYICPLTLLFCPTPGWSQLPLPSLGANEFGSTARKNSCTGCLQMLTPKDRVLRCRFRTTGFLFTDGRVARPCCVQYHQGCVKVGPPFTTRLKHNGGLSLPSLPDFPGFICELCTVRSVLERELFHDNHDYVLLAFERMRILDVLNSWSAGTHQQYQSKLRFVRQFEGSFGVSILAVTPVARPPNGAIIPLSWCQQQYSLKTSTRSHKTGDDPHVTFGSTRAIRSAVSLFYKLDFQTAYPGSVILDRAGRTIAVRATIPTDELCCTLMHSGMASRLGEDSTPSEALRAVHIHYLDGRLHRQFDAAPGNAARLEIARAGFSNANLWCAWLRATEHFDLRFCDVDCTHPSQGSQHQLPKGVGCLQERLNPATKASRTIQADVVISYTTGSGISPGLWYDRIMALEGLDPSTAQDDTRLICRHPSGARWDSGYLRNTYLYPSLTDQRLSGEPTLQKFDGSEGNTIPGRFWSCHSWRRGANDHVSKKRPGCRRKAHKNEVDEHGRWKHKRSTLSMQMAYRQWPISDRVTLTLCCQ